MDKKKSTPKSSLKKTKSASKSEKKSAAKEKSSTRKGEVKKGVVRECSRSAIVHLHHARRYQQ